MLFRSEAEPTSADHADFAAEPITERLEDHLAEARRQQDRLADLLRTDPAEQPEGWPLRGEILAQVDRLRSELQPGPLPGQAQAQAQVRQPLRALRERHIHAQSAPRCRPRRVSVPGRARPGTVSRVRAMRRR